MKNKFWPMSKLGWSSFLCTILFLVMIFTKLTGNLIRLPFSAQIIAVFGVIGFFLALFSFIVKKDRGGVVKGSLAVCSVVVIWLIVEYVIFPT